MSNPLHSAARDGNIQEVERVLSMPNGLAPDPNDKDALGRTAMHLAAWAGHGPVIKRLAAAGGDVSAIAADNVSCLHFACQKGSSGAVAELLAAKADVQSKDQKKKNTPLHVACEKGFVDCIKLLAEAGADLSVRNKAGKTAFEVCKNEEAKLALPGGFSKLKGEKSAWKEKDPTGFLTHQQELAAKKAEKLRQKLGQGGAKVPDFAPLAGWVPPSKPTGTDGTSVHEEAVRDKGGGGGGGDDDAAGEDAEEESAFSIPASKDGKKQKQKRPAPAQPDAEPPHKKTTAAPDAAPAPASDIARELVSAPVASPVQIGPAGPPPRPEEETGKDQGGRGGGGAGGGGGGGGGGGPPPDPSPAAPTQGGLPGLLASLADIEDMLLDDPENEDLIEMKKNIEQLIEAHKKRK